MSARGCDCPAVSADRDSRPPTPESPPVIAGRGATGSLATSCPSPPPPLLLLLWNEYGVCDGGNAAFAPEPKDEPALVPGLSASVSAARGVAPASPPADEAECTLSRPRVCALCAAVAPTWAGAGALRAASSSRPAKAWQKYAGNQHKGARPHEQHPVKLCSPGCSESGGECSRTALGTRDAQQARAEEGLEYSMRGLHASHTLRSHPLPPPVLSYLHELSPAQILFLLFCVPYGQGACEFVAIKQTRNRGTASTYVFSLLAQPTTAIVPLEHAKR